jgi:hypothetical protein
VYRNNQCTLDLLTAEFKAEEATRAEEVSAEKSLGLSSQQKTLFRATKSLAIFNC